MSSTRTYTGLPARTLAYTYGPDGSRASMVNPAGTWTYAYDAVGRYASMGSPAGTSRALYLDNGRERERDLPNGMITGYAFNGVGALTAQSSPNLAGYGSFAYDGAFNLTGLTANVPGTPSQSGRTTYAYDAKDRLTGESSTRLGGYSQANAYDATGNPTTLRGTAQTFDAEDRLTDPNSNFVYDGNGSPTTYAGTAMTYDPEGRATTLPSSFANVRAGYRGDGLRAWKDVNGSRTYFLYDGDEPVAELDGFGNVTATNVFAPDGLVARGTASGWTQYAFDPEGSVAQRLDANGNVLSASAYDAYGGETSTGTVGDPFGYHGRDGYCTDRETVVVYCQNRYYDPRTGHWVTRDPIGYAGGINLYSYCGSGPIGWNDASGLIPVSFPDGPSFNVPDQATLPLSPKFWSKIRQPLDALICAEREASLLRKQRDLQYELDKFDPIADRLGACGMGLIWLKKGDPGYWGPGGHEKEINDLINGIQNDMNDITWRCPQDPPSSNAASVTVGEGSQTNVGAMDGPIGSPAAGEGGTEFGGEYGGDFGGFEPIWVP